MSDSRPLIALTLGDVSGVGPEIVARAWAESPLHSLVRAFVVGDVRTLERAARGMAGLSGVRRIAGPEDVGDDPRIIPCLQATAEDLDHVVPGRLDARSGRAAYDFLIAAIDLALGGRIDAITTLPLNKEALHMAGIDRPGHTEILAERCGVSNFSMMLYLAARDEAEGAGFGVVHATLHVALRRIFELLTLETVFDKIKLADSALRPLTSGRPPRVAVAGLNPHAGENGLFGDEEIRILGPAVEQARAQGIDVTGPVAADTLFGRALAGEFDAVVAMYHDQGHVALKTIGFDRAVNVTLGLPIVRTSVAHGTAFDIVGRGLASTSSLIEAVKVAARIVEGRRSGIGTQSPDAHG